MLQNNWKKVITVIKVTVNQLGFNLGQSIEMKLLIFLKILG